MNMDNSNQNGDEQLENQLGNLTMDESNNTDSKEDEEIPVHSDQYSSSCESDSEESEDDEEILQLKITLKGVTPKIWRRIQIPSDGTFEDLHDYIQEAMGWMCCHLHQFETPDGNRIVTKDAHDFEFELLNELDSDSDTLVETDVEIRDYFSEVGDKVNYIYDMGDWWEHEVELEAILPENPNVFYPKCVAGKRACPPEDCGGPAGYTRLLTVIADPSHQEHEELTDWLENVHPGFNPEKFSKKKKFNTLTLDMKKFVEWFPANL